MIHYAMYDRLDVCFLWAVVVPLFVPQNEGLFTPICILNSCVPADSKEECWWISCLLLTTWFSLSVGLWKVQACRCTSREAKLERRRTRVGQHVQVSQGDEAFCNMVSLAEKKSYCRSLEGLWEKWWVSSRALLTDNEGAKTGSPPLQWVGQHAKKWKSFKRGGGARSYKMNLFFFSLLKWSPSFLFGVSSFYISWRISGSTISVNYIRIWSHTQEAVPILSLMFLFSHRKRNKLSLPELFCLHCMWPSNPEVPQTARRITLWSLSHGLFLFHYVMLDCWPSRRKGAFFERKKLTGSPPFTSPFQTKVKKIVMGRRNLWAHESVQGSESWSDGDCLLKKSCIHTEVHSVQWSTHCRDLCGRYLELSRVALGTRCWKPATSLVAFCMVSCWPEFLQSILLEEMT